ERCSSGEVDDHGCIHPRICRADSRDAHPRSEDIERPAATRHMPRLEYAARCQVAEVGHRGAALIEARPGQPRVAGWVAWFSAHKKTGRLAPSGSSRARYGSESTKATTFLDSRARGTLVIPRGLSAQPSRAARPVR